MKIKLTEQSVARISRAMTRKQVKGFRQVISGEIDKKVLDGLLAENVIQNDDIEIMDPNIDHREEVYF